MATGDVQLLKIIVLLLLDNAFVRPNSHDVGKQAHAGRLLNISVFV